jgi:hypothetical protein
VYPKRTLFRLAQVVPSNQRHIDVRQRPAHPKTKPESLKTAPTAGSDIDVKHLEIGTKKESGYIRAVIVCEIRDEFHRNLHIGTKN